MARATLVNLSSLDPDSYRASLVAFLQAQARFKDYDFTGSNISVLLDILAQNGFMFGVYENMGSSEMFHSTAQLRDSLVVSAKDLNYLPRSMTSAKAIVSMSIQASGVGGTLSIPKGTSFSGQNDKDDFIFVTDKTRTLTSTTGTFTIDDLEIFEGSYFSESMIISGDEAQRLIASNSSIDAASVEVYVSETISGTPVQYRRARNLYGLTDESQVFFVEAVDAGRYQVLFGDGVFGYRPPTGSLVTLTYRVTRGEDGNSVKTFGINQDLGALNGGALLTQPVVTTVGVSAGGSDRESIESIRFNAPRHYQTQDRAVIASDYKQMIIDNFPDVKDVSVYGGETVFGSVEYGRVFLALSTQTGTPPSMARKNEIRNFIKDSNTFGITPVVVDPDYLYVVPSLTVHVDFNKTSMTPEQIKTAVRAGVTSFNDDYLERFKVAFRQSKFTKVLSDLDDCIESIEVESTLLKRRSPPIGSPYALELSFENDIQPGLVTNQFVIGSKTYIITDVIDGVTVTNDLYLLEQSATNSRPVYSKVGTVNRTEGSINISALTYADLISGSLNFYADPVYEDSYAEKRDVILIDPALVSIEIVKAVV